MSLQINPPAGTREAVKRHIAELVSQHKAKLPATTDAAQAEAVSALLVAEIDSLPEAVNGCRVHCEATAHQGARVIQVSILPQHVLV